MTRNLELPPEVLDALKRAAKAAGQTPSDWIADRLPTELGEQHRFLEAVQEGLSDSESGRLLDDEELGAELDAELAFGEGAS